MPARKHRWEVVGHNDGGGSYGHLLPVHYVYWCSNCGTIKHNDWIYYILSDGNSEGATVREEPPCKLPISKKKKRKAKEKKKCA